MKTIYVLTEGSYSDYHIIGVYSTKELVEEAQSLYEHSQIEEYDLDNIPEHPPGMKAWFVQIENGGNDHYTRQVGPSDQTIPHEFEYEYPNHGDKSYFVNCWAVDKDHAQKIALDKYYQHQATKAGIA